MKIKKIYKVGDTLLFSKFAFDNIGGGTGLSDDCYCEKFTGLASGIIMKMFDDYETGIHLHCKPTSRELIDYMKRNSKKQLVYVSEFEIIE
jgi:hypothetical protein